MTSTRTSAVPRRSATKAAGLTLGAAALWILLAAANPGTTYHFAPLIVAGAAPVSVRLDRGEPLAWREAGALTAMSVAVAVVIAIALAIGGRLDGPALVGGSGGETAIGLAMGAVVGFVVAVIGPRPQA